MTSIARTLPVHVAATPEVAAAAGSLLLGPEPIGAADRLASAR
jgi:hypothetical protein